MDACIKIRFYSPLQVFVHVAGIFGTGAVMLILTCIC